MPNCGDEFCGKRLGSLVDDARLHIWDVLPEFSSLNQSEWKSQANSILQLYGDAFGVFHRVPALRLFEAGQVPHILRPWRLEDIRRLLVKACEGTPGSNDVDSLEFATPPPWRSIMYGKS